MTFTHLRSFKGQPWSALNKYLEKDAGSKKASFSAASPETQNSRVCLNLDDMYLYGKYPNCEPFILALCGFCGLRLKYCAMAQHIASRHADGKTIENSEKGSSKVDPKSPNSITKKSKVKANKPNLVVKSKDSTSSKENLNHKETLNNKASVSSKESLVKTSLPNKYVFNVISGYSAKESANNKVTAYKEPTNNKDTSSSKESLGMKESVNFKEALCAKESADKREDTLHSLVRLNKPSKVIIQVDRKRVNCTNAPADKDLFTNNRYSDTQDHKSSIELPKHIQTKSKIDPTLKSDTSLKLKRFRDDKVFPAPKQSSKLLVNGSTEHVQSSFLARNKDQDKITDSTKKKVKNNILNEQEKLDNSKFTKMPDEKPSKRSIVPVENGILDDQSDEYNIESKRRKVMPKTRIYNPDRHCGVIGKEKSKPCTRSLSCKSHTMSLRRAVRGRSKNFDQLLADLRAEKECSKRKINDAAMEINFQSNHVIKNINLTPVRIPLVLDPRLSEVEPVKDIHCNLLPIKSINLNGLRMNCNVNSEIIHNIKKHNHFQHNNITRKKLKNRKKKGKGNVKKSQVKCFSVWHPWYRRIGGMLYTQNNLPSFANLRRLKKKVKSRHYVDKKENSRYTLHPSISEGSYDLMKSLIEE